MGDLRRAGRTWLRVWAGVYIGLLACLELLGSRIAAWPQPLRVACLSALVVSWTVFGWTPLLSRLQDRRLRRSVRAG